MAKKPILSAGLGGVRATSPTVGSGDVHANVSAGVNLTGTPGVKPTILIGQSQGAQTGASVGGTVGGLAGSAIGGPVGGAVGSAVGSAEGSAVGGAYSGGKNTAGALIGVALGDPTGGAIGSAAGGLLGGGKDKDHAARDSVRGNVTSSLGGSEFQLPDGTTANFSLDAHDGLHDFKYGDKRTDQEGNRKLYAYDTDYTNDLDYLAGMGGTTLSRLINGGKAKNVDQLGGLIGNQSLGSVGFGKDLSQDNFSKVMTNQRAMYAQAGIQNKEQLTALANKAYADGRINDSDHAVALQTANLVFGNDFNLATQLSAGRWGGIKTAAGTPSGTAAMPSGPPTNRAGRIYSPIISPDEAIMSTQPFVDLYNKSRKQGYNSKINKNLQTGASIAQGIAMATGIYSIGNKLTGGALGDGIKGAASAFSGGISDLYHDITGSSPGVDAGSGSDLGGSADPGALDLGSIDTSGVGGADLGGLDLG